MIVDASAVLAILRGEPDAAFFASALADRAVARRMSAANYLEAAIVIDSAREPVASRRFDDLVARAEIAIEAVTADHAAIARAAYRDYGKGGGHPAQLNFGDCFAYALARSSNEPLLCKGDDFVHTDVVVRRPVERPMILSHSSNEEATAYHEAGHAVVGAARGRPPIFVTIIPDGGAAGKNEFPKDWRPEFKSHLGDTPEKRTYIETRILTEVAGTVAHDLRFPERGHDAGDAYDERCARALIEENAGWADSDRDTYFRQLQEAARVLLQSNWPWVEAVARALIRRKTISTSEVMELRRSG